MKNDVPHIFKKKIELFVGSHFVSRILFIYVWFHEYFYLYDKVCYVSHTVIKSFKSKLTIIIIS